ncbi:ABC transporter ATP-binding protein [Myxococcota bacterium]|nr:ABC transporter ATP-binding protein [Myxococcota bacterium]MBU1430545.1 ABC transporter ATP-binding protein [Myxococcota bacterium]MBU1899768.1 ABC transporter ATP-binding protein [Myxococcota bacterium]
MTSPLLQVRGLKKSFEHQGRRIEVLRGLDLDIAVGERIAVLGTSGAGKSTLLNVLGTLDLPTEGQIWFEGRDLLTLSAKQLAAFRNQQIGFMFQFHHLLPEFTALENVMMPALIARRAKAEAAAEARQLLDAVGLKDRLTHRPGELSGGEQQRVALARALVGRPALLLADEPTGNLDSQTSAGIHALFDQVNAEFNTALLVVTHNQDLAQRMPRRIFMHDGLLREEATA